jgi:hypothetical protein
MVPRDSFATTLESNVVENLAKLERGLKEQVARSGARAGILVFYHEMRRLVPVHEGTLHDSIYHYHDETPPKDWQQYFAGPNKRKAPHWHQVEYGHWLVNVVVRMPDRTLKATKERRAAPKWVPGQPYVRPAYDSKRAAAAGAVKTRMAERYKELVREIA